MTKQYYLTKEGEEPRLQGFSKVPSSLGRDGWTVIQAPPEAEHAEDLDIIEETDELGGTRKRIVVNETKRQARLDREAAKRAEQEAKEADKKARKDAAKSAVLGVDPKSVKLEDVVAFLQAHYGE